MKVEILLVEKNYDLIEESNYFEQSKPDSDKVWQCEITNGFIVLLFLFKIARISNLNEILHVKELIFVFMQVINVEFIKNKDDDFWVYGVRLGAFVFRWGVCGLWLG